MLEHLLDTLFPPRCAGCGRGPWPFCAGCGAALQRLQPPWCRRCGSPSSSERSICADCPPEPITIARAAFRFDGPARAAIHRLKFSGWRGVAGALGREMATAWRLGQVGAEPLAVAWVPLSRRRKAERGFDQAAALAREVGRGLDLPVRSMLSRDGRDRTTQARRGRAERLAAMRGRFRVLTRPPCEVLLVDDVLTTGATASACAAALVDAGARRVHVLTAARALTPPRRARGSGPGADILADGLASGSVVARGVAPR